MNSLTYSVGALLLAACAGRGTTLSESRATTVVPEGRAEVRWGKLTAQLVDNRVHGPVHREGYNGVKDLSYDGAPSPFVPAVSGLNLEHVNNGAIYADRKLQFEPRNHPMELRRLDATTYELYQAPLPNTGLESCTRFEFREPHDIDVTFECIPRLEKFPHGHLNVFWASYFEKPADPAINFLGRRKGESGESWIRAVSPAHGDQATHRGAGDRREFAHDDPFPLTLVYNESVYEFTRPFYYGRYGDLVWIVMFREEDGVRLAQSPSGGGTGNPAWDFQWFIDRPRVGQVYRLRMRAVYKPWVDQEDVLREFDRFRREIS